MKRLMNINVSRKMQTTVRHLAILSLIALHLSLITLLSSLLMGCSEDTPGGGTSQGEGYWQEMSIEALAAAPAYEELLPPETDKAQGSRSTTVTRGGEDDPVVTTWTQPDPYVLYSGIYSSSGLFYSHKNLTDNTINAFFTLNREDNDPLNVRIRKGSDGKWKLGFKNDPNPKLGGEQNDELKDGTYCVYGYIPSSAADGATITQINAETGYNVGAVLTINGLKPIGNYDACVIIGAREGFRVMTDETHGTDYDGGWDDVGESGIGTYEHSTDTRKDRLRPGYFGYAFRKSAVPPMFLLFDHLYSALRFRFTVNETYDALRTIKLKKVEIKTNVRKKYNCTITLRANDGSSSPISSITMTPDGTSDMMSESDYFPLFNSSDLDGEGNPVGELMLTHTGYTSFMGGFVPGDETVFDLRSTYDIYDKEGNPTRQNQQAVNTIRLKDIFTELSASLTRGTYYTVNLIVNPTYLGVLSDSDLDNPTIKIES